MSTVHKNLTGADLHEPKGADTATSGKVYVSNGAGSGVWTDASTIITNTAFTTGDVKSTFKVTADTGWILWGDGSIGDASSSATIRANADTAALYSLYWVNYSDTICPVSGGRGGSSGSDFAAHKRLTLPYGPGRVIGIAGTSGSGLTTRVVGTPIGTETNTLVTANLPPYTPAGTIGGSALFSNQFLTWSQTGAGTRYDITTSNAAIFTGTPQGGTSTPVNNIQPTIFINAMIKL